MQAHAQQLVKLGTRATAYGVADAYTEIDRISWAPVQVRICKPIVSRFAYSPELDRAILQANHDIIHQHGLWLYPSMAVSRWRQRTGRNVIISLQGMLEPWSLANSNLKKSIAARLFERSNLSAAACVHCSAIEVEGVRAFGVKCPIAVIPNGVDPPDPSPEHRRPHWLPSDGLRVLLFLGRLHPKKGIRETLEAWKLLRSQNPRVASQWRLVVAGWDDRGHLGELQSIAASLDLKDVLFPGAVYGEDKNALLANSDAFVLASYSEGLPMAVLEAWSYSLPVFMTRYCNLPEGFTSGAAFEISTNPPEIASILARTLNDVELGEVGRRGRLLVERRFAWSPIGAQLHSLYHWLETGGDRPPFVILN